MSKKGLPKTALILLAVILLAALAAGGVVLVRQELFYSEASAEAGTEILADDLLKPDRAFPASILPLAKHAEFADESSFDPAVPGEYETEVILSPFRGKVALKIVDTTKPAAIVKDVEAEKGANVSPEDFIEEITDNTEVSVSFEAPPDTNTRGIQETALILTDLGGNRVRYTAKLVISKVQPEVKVEAGQTLPGIESFLMPDLTEADREEARFVTPRSSLSTVDTGKFPLTLNVGGEEYGSFLIVEDTVPPTGVMKEVSAYNTSELSAEQFVESTEDATEVTVSFAKDPDMSVSGEQQVMIALTDGAGNRSELPAKLTLSKDTEAPVITGAKDIVYFIGDNAAFKQGVSCTDNCDRDIELQVDRDRVDLEKEGEYPLLYFAIDKAGNRTEKTVNLKVLVQEYDKDELDAKADEILAGILKEGMSDYEKAHAIFVWIKGHIFYRETSQKDNPLQAISEGLVGRSGDCFVYAMSAKELLTRAGIPNEDIQKIPRSHHHFWNLVDVGTGWLHFDTTPRVSDHPNIFLWTDEELMEYSGRHYGSHNYDRSLYPEVNGTKPVEMQ